jgi:hypothetical protein
MADFLKAVEIAQGEVVPLQFRQWYVQDRDHAQDWRDDAKEDFDFVAGRQLTDTEIRTLQRRKRPIVMFNRTSAIIDAITGYEIGNRREVRYIPREEGDVRPNELLTSAGQWFRDQGYADYADSAMFASCVICGMGWTETRVNAEEGPEPKPVVDEIDPFEMAWDKDARQRNLKDARRVWRVRRIPLDEAQAMFPDYDENELNASWAHVSSEADLMREQETATDEDYVTVVQCQWVTKETFWLIKDPMTGQQAEFTTEEYETLTKRLEALAPDMNVEGVQFKRKVRKQAFLGEVVLSYGPAPCNDGFSLQCVTGKYDRNKGTWYGIVRAMKDPQRWANKWLMQMMHIMNANAKGGIMAERGVFKDVRKAESEWAQPDSITEMEDGAISGNKIAPKPSAQFPVGFQQLTEFAISSIRDVSGVSLEMLGQREIDQPASLEYQRRQAGINNLQWVFDGLKLYREMQGKVILYYLQNDIPEGTLVRVLGEGDGQYARLIREADKTFDIIVDDAPQAPNQKEQVWSIVQSMLPLVGKVIPAQYFLKVLKYSPLPSSIVAELEKMAAAPNPQAQKQAELQVRAAMAEIENTQSETQLNQAKAQAEGSKGAVEQAKAQTAQIEQVGKRDEHQMRMVEMAGEMEMSREEHQMDMQKSAAQIAMTRAKAQRPQAGASR